MSVSTINNSKKTKLYLIFLGKIVKTKGNRGEVVIQTPPDFPSHHYIKDGVFLDLKSEKYHIRKKIHRHRLTHGEAIVQFDGIDSIQLALKLVGYNVFSNDNEKKSPNNQPENLVGFSVEDMEKKRWGIINGISRHHMNHVLEVTGEDHSYLIPFHHTIVVKIDKARKIITIDPPEGLENINK